MNDSGALRNRAYSTPRSAGTRSSASRADGREVLPVRRQLAEREVRRQRGRDRAACRPARTRRPAARRRVPDVEVRVEVADHRQVGRGAPGDRRRADVHVRGRPERDGGARRPRRGRASTARTPARPARTRRGRCSVSTPVTRPPRASEPVTPTPSRNVTPRAWAPLAKRQRREARVDVAVLRLVEAAHERRRRPRAPNSSGTRSGAIMLGRDAGVPADRRPGSAARPAGPACARASASRAARG